jgi:hypothetical protein
MTTRGREWLVGLLFIGLGILGLVFSLRYNLMNGTRIGPGAFPAGLAGIMALLGVVQCLIAFKTKDRSAAEPFRWRPVVFICLAVLLFGVFVERTGAVAALAFSAFVAGFAGGRPKYSQVLIVYLTILAFAYFVVVMLIGMQLPLF